jgi:protein-S-isoprenylcysteine O-methyltransferase Ste14
MDVTIELVARVVVATSGVSLLAVALAVLVRELATRRPEPVERDTGPLALVNYAGILLFVALGVAFAVTRWASAGALAEPLGDALRVLGVVTVGAAGALALWGIRAMGRNLASGAEVRPDTEIVTSGPFGLVRHPMYLSILLMWLGGALALLNGVLAVGFLVFVPAFELRARLEEEMLSRHFGDAYAAYSKRVPRLMPRFR